MFISLWRPHDGLRAEFVLRVVIYIDVKSTLAGGNRAQITICIASGTLIGIVRGVPGEVALFERLRFGIALQSYPEPTGRLYEMSNNTNTIVERLGREPNQTNRISNKDVRSRACQPALSKQLLCQQLLFFGKIARADDTDAVRSLTFQPGTFFPANDAYVRVRGRPKLEWAKMVLQEAVAMSGSLSAMEAAAQNLACT